MKRVRARTFNGVRAPAGDVIAFGEDNKPITPMHPIIPFIEGDGIGADITVATRAIIDAAVRLAYAGERDIRWFEVFAGDKAKARFGQLLPRGTTNALKHFGVALKGPLSTPTGGGARSLNVRMRKLYDLYSCVRPVRYYKGVPSVMKRPGDLDVVIFRENTQDVYAGIEFKMGSRMAKKFIALVREAGFDCPDDTGIGIKIMSRTATRRIVRAALQYAVDHNRRTVTIVHKGNIQKYTEGAFLLWGLELAREEFGDIVVSEEDLWKVHGGKLPEGKILLNHRIADAAFAELLLKPKQFSVICAMNLNGDYLSDATAAQVGGLGIAPGSNIGVRCAIFEATHGSALDIAGKNLANPCSLALSAVMMLEYLGWTEAAGIITRATEKTIRSKQLTGDLARLLKNVTGLSTSQFADAVIANMAKPRRRK